MGAGLDGNLGAARRQLNKLAASISPKQPSLSVMALA
jgi:hypothetical protein